MAEVATKRKVSCQQAFETIPWTLKDKFVNDCMKAFGVTFKGNIIRKIKGANLNQIEIEAFEKLFAKYGVTEIIWTDVN